MKGLFSNKADIAHEVFSSLGAVKLRSQFGGFGVWLDKTMFGVVSDGELYLRAHDELKSRFVTYGMKAFIYTKRGIPVRLSYYRVECNMWDDPSLLRHLAYASLQQSIELKSLKAAESDGLRTLPNINNMMERLLGKIGITSADQLISMGETEAFIRLKKLNANLHNRLLFDLAGAVRKCHESALSYQVRMTLDEWLKNNTYRWQKK